MRVLAVLLLVGAAAASPPVVPVVQQENAHFVPEMKSFSIFGVPKFNRDFFLPHEKFGVKGLYDKSFIVAVKNPEKEEISAFLLRGGLSSLYNHPELGFMRNMLLTGPPKVGIMLSAARYLDLPEMSMPINKVVLPHDFTLASQFRISQDGENLPWMFITSKDDLRLGSLDKLMEIGLFSIDKEKVQLSRDLLTTTGLSNPAVEQPIQSQKSIYNSYNAQPFVNSFDETEYEPEHDEKFHPLYQRVLSKPIVRVLNENKYSYVPVQTVQRSPETRQFHFPGILTRGQGIPIFTSPSGYNTPIVHVY